MRIPLSRVAELAAGGPQEEEAGSHSALHVSLKTPHHRTCLGQALAAQFTAGAPVPQVCWHLALNWDAGTQRNAGSIGKPTRTDRLVQVGVGDQPTQRHGKMYKVQLSAFMQRATCITPT